MTQPDDHTDGFDANDIAADRIIRIIDGMKKAGNACRSIEISRVGSPRGRMASMAALPVALLLIGCTVRDRTETTPEPGCPPIRICSTDIALPSPSTLTVTPEPIRQGDAVPRAVRRDFGDRVVFGIGPRKPAGWTDRQGSRHVSRRVFFVAKSASATTGSIWVVFDHPEGTRPETQILEKRFDRSTMTIKVQGSDKPDIVEFQEIALVDRATGIGPTFISTYAHPRYVRLDYGSRGARWRFDHPAPCGQELVPVPKAWEDEAAHKRRVCAAQRARAAAPWYRRLIGLQPPPTS